MQFARHFTEHASTAPSKLDPPASANLRSREITIETLHYGPPARSAATAFGGWTGLGQTNHSGAIDEARTAARRVGRRIASSCRPNARRTGKGKVVGIGGFFFRSRNPKALAQWHEQNLGISLIPTSPGAKPWQQQAGPTAFMPFTDSTNYFPRDHQWMLNFRVPRPRCDGEAARGERNRSEGGSADVPQWAICAPRGSGRESHRALGTADESSFAVGFGVSAPSVSGEIQCDRCSHRRLAPDCRTLGRRA